jgi:hypothetical protein
LIDTPFGCQGAKENVRSASGCNDLVQVPLAPYPA